jgi:trimeric autotransporter adhesin
MFSLFRSHSKRRNAPRLKAPQKLAGAALSYERLEVRNVMSTFSVLTLSDSGAGSLRQAILDANNAPGADVISFDVAGSIQLSSSLPKITDEVDIDGTTAPGFTTAPVVEVDFNGTKGLRFEAGSSGSAVQSLALVGASKAGVKLNGVSDVLVVGNYIGVDLGGMAAGNRGDGVELRHSSGNTIGGDTVLERNIISANGKYGVELSSSSNNEILGNYVGTDVAGTLDFGNVEGGLLLKSSSTSNTIGGTTGNVISGNDGDGVHLKSHSSLNTLAGNRIGTNAAGSAALGNSGDGIKIKKSDGNLVGNADPVTSIDFTSAVDGSDFTQPVSAWQGIRGADTDGEFLIVGTSDDNGLLYEGTLDGNSGTSYSVNYPGAVATSVYGPDNLGSGNLRLVGSYRNAVTMPVEVHGFLFEGTTADLGTPGNYLSIDYPGAQFNYIHSTMGGLAVGNYDSQPDHGTHGLPLGPGHAYIYDVNSDTFLTDIVFPGALSNTAYGIWHNVATSYTIVGGYSLDAANNFDDQNQPIGSGYMVDYDTATNQFTNWKSFEYPNGVNFVTHFEGISSVEKGVYTLNADSVQAGSGDPVQGSWVTVRRNTDGSFGDAVWVDLNYEGLDPSTNITSSNSVYGYNVVGIVAGGSPTFSYQATINVGFTLSNVISGNGGNGITLHKADDNRIAMNYIGTDVAGTLDLGNAGNGILVTKKSTDNIVGGEATGGNSPTNDVFVRPPQGNLISGNDSNGVLINSKSTGNQLSGNFIGTTASGNTALGNTLDGVAIEKADGNSLLGCNFQQDPFVFYNVVGGNGGNGLRVNDADDTTIHANFFGMGADNGTALGNALNGVVVEGNSKRTELGGPIPLGNVVAANTQNGVVVQDKASYFTTYNTFSGLAAFSDDPSFGNGQDGMLITSTGGNILIRTNVIARNGDDGIEISGKAKDVRVDGNIIGLNTDGLSAMGNVDNGVEIGGTAHDIVIGGPLPAFSVIPQNTIGANGANGVAIVGTAHHNVVSNGYIGLDVFGLAALGNTDAGVLLGSGTYSNTIGSLDPTLLTVISGNTGSGIEMSGTHDNTVINTYIGVGADGTTPRGNGASGIFITDESYDNVIGSTSGDPTNLIANNIANGIFADSGSGNGLFQNSIFDNALDGIALAAGANLDQAAPVLTNVQTVGSNLHITGTLTSQPKKKFTIEFFANDASDASGQFFLGSLVVSTDSAGDAAFTFVGPLAPMGANFFTATATDPKDNTSEFSADIS